MNLFVHSGDCTVTDQIFQGKNPRKVESFVGVNVWLTRVNIRETLQLCGSNQVKRISTLPIDIIRLVSNGPVASSKEAGKILCRSTIGIEEC